MKKSGELMVIPWEDQENDDVFTFWKKKLQFATAT